MKLFLIVLIALFSLNSFSARRWVDLAWDKIEEASAYDLELHKVKEDGSAELFLEQRVQVNKWSKQINPGKYNFRIRGVDSRSVPGAWSDFSLLDIRLPRPIYLNPLNDDTVKALDEYEDIVEFEWKDVEGANAYLLQIWNDEGFDKKINTKNTLEKVRLAVAKNYKWRVVSLVNLDDKIPPKAGSGSKFFLQGAPLEAPKIDYKIKDNKAILSWNKPKYTDVYEFQLYKLGLNQKWTIYKQSYDYKNESIEFAVKDLQGEFRLAIKAIGDSRADSPYTFVEFAVKGEEVTVHSIKSQLTNELKKDNPFFYSYGIEQTFLDYYGESRERDTVVETTFKGQRYFLEASYQDFYSLWKHRVGFYLTDVSNVEYSIRLNEFHYLLGKTTLYKGIPFEFAGGLFYKEDLFITGDAFTNTLSFEKIATSGPVAMISPYYRYNRNFDLGAEMKVFVHMNAHETPSNEDINTSFSYYLKGYLTYKYRDNETYTGFFGYYVNDISYKASTEGTSVARDGSDNTARASGFSMGLRVNKFF